MLPVEGRRGGVCPPAPPPTRRSRAGGGVRTGGQGRGGGVRAGRAGRSLPRGGVGAALPLAHTVREPPAARSAPARPGPQVEAWRDAGPSSRTSPLATSAPRCRRPLRGELPAEPGSDPRSWPQPWSRGQSGGGLPPAPARVWPRAPGALSPGGRPPDHSAPGHRRGGGAAGVGGGGGQV